MEEKLNSANGVKIGKAKPKAVTAGRFRQYLAAFVVNLTALSFGCVVGWPSPVQALLQGVESPAGAPLSDELFSWLGAVTFLGGILGNLMWGRVADGLGRKAAGYWLTVPMVCGWSLVLLSSGPSALLAGRFLLGLGGSSCFILAPLYVSEVADDGVRGRLGSFLVLFFNLGVVLAYSAGAWLGYRQFSLLCGAVPLLFLVCFWRLPESPSYLWTKKRFREAEASMAVFRGGDGALVELECRKLAESSKSEGDAGYSDLLGSRGARRAFLIGLVLLGVQQFDGILVVLTYTAAIFVAAGSSFGAGTSAIVVSLFQLAASYVSTSAVERCGRKLLLLVSYGFMAVSLFALGLYFLMLDGGRDVSSYGLVPVVSLCSFIFAYALGSGPVPYVVVSETFEPRIRALATSTLVVWGTTLAFATIKIYPFLMDTIGKAGCFWMFAAFCVFGFVFTLICIPETKGRPLLEILEELNGGPISPQETKDSLANGTRGTGE